MVARTSQSIAAENKFHDLLAAVGAVSLEPEWQGTCAPHRIRCREGHVVTPRPGNVLSGHSPCRTCSGRDSVATEARFRAALVNAGAELLEPTWLGSHKPHRIRCALGHPGSPQPNNVLQGSGVCRACVGHDPVNGEAKFRKRLSELGVTLLEPGWLGGKKPHRAVCAEGHACTPRPSDLLSGHGACRTCVGQDPVVNLAKFIAVLAESGAVLLESGWLGARNPHRILCVAGHESTPRPSDVFGGTGACRVCAGNHWDVFYLVANPSQRCVKFGISSGDPASRLRAHRRAGYIVVVRLLTGLPQSVALEMEQAVRAALRLAKVKPVRGREYHNEAVTSLVLDVVDNYPIPSTA